MTASIQINATKALELLRKAVEDKGADYRYLHPVKNVPVPEESSDPVGVPGCWYEYHGAPSCGVGEALYFGGVPIEVLDKMDRSPEDTGIGAVEHILRDHGVILTWEAVAVLEQFQKIQDLEGTWGQALEYATDTFNQLKEEAKS